MIGDGGTRDGPVAAALRRLGRDPDDTSFASRLLAGGQSGSVVHHVELAGEEMILKVTPPSHGHHLMARARREAWFYRDLATLVPVLVPRVLDVDVSATDGVLLLLAACLPAPAPNAWTEHDYIEVVRQLGRLHATFQGDTPQSGLPDWLRARPAVTPDQCQAAARLWRVLGERDDLAGLLAPNRRSLERLMPDIPALERQMPTMTATLCHGDCHTGNLLRNLAGEWIWADWQEVRLGSGVDDLAFFWQRAFAATEAPPPHDAMVRAYLAGLATVDGALISRDQIDRALAWAELRSWLMDWPGYLGSLPTGQIARVCQRIDTLVRRLDLDSHP